MSETSEPTANDQASNIRTRFDRRQVLVLTAVLAATAMFTIDMTIVTVALPAIGEDLSGSSLVGLQWVIIGYTVAFGSLLQISGSLTDAVGVKRMFLYGIAGFAVASLICGLASTMLMLNIARAIQGVAAAVMFASVMPLIARTFAEDARARAIGIWSAVLGGAAVLAPVFGGFLVDAVGWRSMFLINIPVGVVAFFLVRSLLAPDTRNHRPVVAAFDLAGAVLLGSALLSINLGLAKAQETGWSDRSTLTAFGLGALLLVAFGFRELRAPAPILDLALVRNRTFVGVSLLALLNRIGTVGATVYLVILLQRGFGYSPSQTGLLLVPLGIAVMAVSLWAGNAQSRFDPRTLLGAGFALMTAASVLLAWQIGQDQDPRLLLPGTVVWGIGSALANTPLMAVTTSAVPIERVGMATGLVNSFFPIGAGLGTAILGVVFAARAGTDAESFTRTGLASANATIYAIVAALMLAAVFISFGVLTRRSSR